MKLQVGDILIERDFEGFGLEIRGVVRVREDDIGHIVEILRLDLVSGWSGKYSLSADYVCRHYKTIPKLMTDTSVGHELLEAQYPGITELLIGHKAEFEAIVQKKED